MTAAVFYGHQDGMDRGGGWGTGHDNVLADSSVLPGQAGALRRRRVNEQVQAILGKGVSRSFREVTPENIKTFHFHGDEKEFPLTAGDRRAGFG